MNLNYTVNYCAYFVRLTRQRTVACTKRSYEKDIDQSKVIYGY